MTLVERQSRGVLQSCVGRHGNLDTQCEVKWINRIHEAEVGQDRGLGSSLEHSEAGQGVLEEEQETRVSSGRSAQGEVPRSLLARDALRRNQPGQGFRWLMTSICLIQELDDGDACAPGCDQHSDSRLRAGLRI